MRDCSSHMPRKGGLHLSWYTIVTGSIAERNDMSSWTKSWFKSLRYLPEVKEPLRVREEHALNMERLNLGVTFRPFLVFLLFAGWLRTAMETGPTCAEFGHLLRSSFGKRFGERSNKDSDGSTGLRLRGSRGAFLFNVAFCGSFCRQQN